MIAGAVDVPVTMAASTPAQTDTTLVCMYMYISLLNIIQSMCQQIQPSLYSVDIELAQCIVLIHCTARGYTPCAIDFSRGFWYSTLPSYPFAFESDKFLTASTNV